MGLLDSILLGAWLVALAFGLYLPAMLPLRLLEYAIGRRNSPVSPSLPRFLSAHLLAALGHALFTPAVCYVFAGLVYKGGGFTDPDAFTGSAWFHGTVWLASLLLPVQFHYTLNRRLFSTDAEQTVRPAWLMLLWGVNSCLAASLMWLPLWLGWLHLAPPWD